MKLVTVETNPRPILASIVSYFDIIGIVTVNLPPVLLSHIKASEVLSE